MCVYSQPFNEFATSQAIQCTEVYEYATSLSNEPVFMAPFQLYKFLYCVRLVDAGMWEEVSTFTALMCYDTSTYTTMILC